MKNKVTIIFLTMTTILGIMTSCEHSTTVPLDPPAYNPHLMIFGNASPQSGVRVIVRYNQPLEGLTGTVPPIPELEITLWENDIEKYLLHEDSTGYYSLPASVINLNKDHLYHIKVVDQETMEVYESSQVLLPEQPSILETNIVLDPSYRSSFLDISLGAVADPVPAVSIIFIRLDSLQNDLEPRKFSSKLQGYNMHYPEEELWTSKEFSRHEENFVRTDDNGSIPAHYFDLHVTFLSKELGRFARDINETFYYGEDIFQAVRPVYSNIEGDHGVFGLYAEDSVRIAIQ